MVNLQYTHIHIHIFINSVMDSGLGIGGLSLGKDEVSSSAFDLFSKIEVENSIKAATKVTARPIATTTSRGPFNFCFPADPEKWTDCESLRLSGKVTLLKGDGSKFDADVKEISVVNNFYHSLFSSVVCTLNGVEITDPGGNWYSYKAYLETLLSYSDSTKTGRLATSLWQQDEQSKYDSLGSVDVAFRTTTESQNRAYKLRKDTFKNSQTRYFNIPVHSDISTLRKYLPPDAKLEFEFRRTSDAFSLLSPYNPAYAQIHIEDLSLTLMRYTPTSAIKSYYSSKLSSIKKQILPIDRSFVKTYTVQTGQTDLSHYNFISGHQLPEQIIIGMVDQQSHSGEIAKNPFNFKHFNITQASIVVNGVHEPAEPHRINIDDNNYVNLYTDFLLNCGISNEDRDFGVSEKDYIGGCFLLAFDRSKEKCNRFHRHPHDSGTIDINLRTSTNLPNTVTVIVYATYSSEIVLDDVNNVTIVNAF